MRTYEDVATVQHKLQLDNCTYPQLRVCAQARRMWDGVRVSENRRQEEAFHILCESFERNDPKSTEFACRGLQPKGYGHRLGEALCNNTIVSNLHLDVPTFFAHDEVNPESAAPLILFIRSSPSLRQVGVMRNLFHPCVQRVLAAQDAALVDQIWNAVAENPHITSVVSDFVTQSFRSLPNIVQASQSIKKLSVSMAEDVDGSLLAEAIRANAVL
jgi:hypothetical protein